LNDFLVGENENRIYYLDVKLIFFSVLSCGIVYPIVSVAQSFVCSY